jgi:hypothetical protein
MSPSDLKWDKPGSADSILADRPVGTGMPNVAVNASGQRLTAGSAGHIIGGVVGTGTTTCAQCRRCRWSRISRSRAKRCRHFQAHT